MLHVFHVSHKIDSLMIRSLGDDVVDVKCKKFKYSNCVAIIFYGFFSFIVGGADGF